MSRIQSFDFSIDLLRVILWQYDKADRLVGLLNNKQIAMDENQRDFWQDWYDNVFNLDTANEFGLAVWAIIMNVPLLINAPIVNPDKVGWGFGEFRENFNNGNFNESASGAQFLTIEQRRIVLKMRYRYLTIRPTIPNINQTLINAFGDLGTVFVTDNQDMTMEYTMQFSIPSWIQFVFEELTVFPTPSTVSATLVGL